MRYEVWRVRRRRATHETVVSFLGYCASVMDAYQLVDEQGLWGRYYISDASGTLCVFRIRREPVLKT